jgi:hypothetical protein
MRFLALTSLFLVLATTAVADESESIQLAQQATASWLELVDGGDFAASWREAAAPFRQQLTEQNWVDAVTAARQPFGSLISRRVQDARYSTAMPGAPDGEYVVLTFEAAYENKAAATETVTAMMDGSEWRVAGYYIR